MNSQQNKTRIQRIHRYIRTGRRKKFRSTKLKLNELSISSQDGAAEASEELNSVLDNMIAIRGRLGSTQNRLDTALNNTLQAAENLNAAGSKINDADMASEFARLTKQQILVQSSSAMIGQSNLFPQGVIQLLPQ